METLLKSSQNKDSSDKKAEEFMAKRCKLPKGGGRLKEGEENDSKWKSGSTREKILEMVTTLANGQS